MDTVLLGLLGIIVTCQSSALAWFYCLSAAALNIMLYRALIDKT
jgi:hypothetical protein